jgi:hypothetical protein
MRTIGSLFLASVLAFGATPSAQAQVWGGPRLGVSISNLGGDDAPDADSRTGMVVGWSFHFDRGSRVGFQPEFHYWEKGADTRFFGLDTELKATYLDIPLLLRLDLTEGGTVSPHVILGPTVGINLTCEVRVTGGPISGKRDCEDTDGLDVKTLELGVGGGFGLAMDMGGWRLLADARYTVGMTDIFEDVNARNRGFGITAGVSFPLTY